MLDPAVVELLKLDSENTSASSAGGGGCSSASTYKIVTKLKDGSKRSYFMKTGRGKDAAMMFEGEHASLEALHAVVPSLAPQSFGHGQFSGQPSTYFLVTDYLNLKPCAATKACGRSLASKLGELHTTPAPIPEGYSKPVFGFPATTCCGDTPQDNSYQSSWAEFYAENRLRFILRRSEESNGPDQDLSALVEATASKVVPRLLGDDHLNGGKGVVPVVVHGDLWSGNAGFGILDSRGGDPEPVVYDSSACYAHSEFELGIMKMFGGFGGSFLDEYHQICPRTEPVEEYEDRVRLYELYHHLNHHAIFGGGYRSGAIAIMKSLVQKYGKD
ncbi:Ketosamine-3-kinase [Aaosphaeria arxii CBS 175.79]|uniref:protein-ribulosamine 3-kinase n=1 Tax=Aaosphaeria arxii CBS 175.79 TaxID=1450172 RepID=A0A6A5XCR1_9PLEO|nr:Ketosamine-3-kinase [Aaosphaeria arxii CBS 175.79]KAF2010710.1 Ketosamine-3-kinase [Aaosphaeria arxii CBS 175.79]